MTGSLLRAACLVVVAAVAAGCSLFQAKLVEPVETWEYACWQGFDTVNQRLDIVGQRCASSVAPAA